MKLNTKKKKIIALTGLIIIGIIIILVCLYFNNKRNINKISEQKKQETTNQGEIDATYRVRKINGNEITTTVYFKSNVGIKKIIKPDGIELTTLIDNKNEIAVDYQLIAGSSYIFKVQLVGSNEEKEYTLYADENSKPVITQNNSLLYPLITLYGVTLNKNVSIDYGNETNNYYSLDGGENWIKYEGEFTLQKECTIIARSFKEENEIVKVDSTDIKMNLAADATRKEAYDGNDATYYRSGKYHYMRVDQSVIGRKIRVYESVESFELYICDENRNTIKHIDIYGWGRNNQIIDIPENTYFLKFCSGEAINEVQIYNTPSFSNELHYPTLTTEGVEDGYNIIKGISYFETCEKKLYSLDEGATWIDYNNEEIKLEIGKKIYAKSIDKYGQNSTIATYTAVLPNDAMGKAAYDGDLSTYFQSSNSPYTFYIEVDSSMIGKKVKVIQNQESFEIQICDSNKNVIQNIDIYGWAYGTTTISIPEGTKFLRIGYGKRIGEFIPVE